MIASFQHVTKSKPGTLVDTLFRITFIDLFVHVVGYFFPLIDFFFIANLFVSGTKFWVHSNEGPLTHTSLCLLC